MTTFYQLTAFKNSKCNLIATILDITLETNPIQIRKLMHIHKANFVTPFPKFNAVNRGETTFGIMPADRISTRRLFYKEHVNKE